MVSSSAGPMDSLIDEIYEAAVVPEQWPRVLDRLARIADGVGGILMTGDMTKWVASPNAVEIVQNYLDQGWHSRTQRTERLFRRGVQHPGFIGDLDVFSEEELEEEAVYAEFFRPSGWGWGAGTIIAAPSGDLIAFDVERPYQRGPFEREAVDRLDRLRPHLARAALLSGRLALERMRSAAEALEVIGLGAAVFNAGRRPLAINRIFEGLLGSLFRIRANRIAALNSSADVLLNEAFQSVGMRENRETVRSIPLPASEDQPPTILHVIPIRGAAHDIFSGAAGLLVVTPLVSANAPSAELLQGLFDLTPAEARVARAIAQRQTVSDIAEALDLSRETVRTQLKSVLSKTGQSRQLDLAVMLTSSFQPGKP